ncbi:MAG: ABC transporter ATP-binding protein [Planctomycetes bacterium]|nr:ABC transporter ATP-binding protein [Planctomycetota bacterium]
MQPAVETKNLVHRYGERLALNNLDLTVAPGQIFALLGPNGGGKTTLFRILATLLRPTDGQARVMGLDVRQSPHDVRRRIGVMFQSPSVDKKLTVSENLRHHGHLYGLSGRALSDRTGEVLATIGLVDRAGERVEKLSGGLMRRVEIAKSLMHRPQVLLLDEPSVGLDPHARLALRNQLEDLRQTWGVTCLLTTHLMDEAETCDMVGIIDEGVLVACGTPSDLRSSIEGDVVTVTSNKAPALRDDIRSRFGADAQLLGDTLRIEHKRGHELATQLADAFGDALLTVTVGRPTLNDVFVKRTGHHLDGASGDSDG